MILLNGLPINITTFPDNTSQVWKIPEYDANEVHLYVTHGIFSKGIGVLQVANIKSVTTRKGLVYEY